MKYFHRTHLSPAEAIARCAAFLGERLAPTEETSHRRRFASALGHLTLSVSVDGGGHYTVVTLATDQPGESELDKIARRCLTLLHASADPSHRPIGAY